MAGSIRSLAIADVGEKGTDVYVLDGLYNGYVFHEGIVVQVTDSS